MSEVSASVIKDSGFKTSANIHKTYLSIIIFLLIGFIYLYWSQIETERINKYRLQIMQEKIESQESAIIELSKNSQASLIGKPISNKNLNSNIADIQYNLNSIKSNLQQLKIRVEGMQNDFDARISNMEAQCDRMSSIEAQLNKNQAELISLRQLIR